MLKVRPQGRHTDIYYTLGSGATEGWVEWMCTEARGLSYCMVVPSVQEVLRLKRVLRREGWDCSYKGNTLLFNGRTGSYLTIAAAGRFSDDAFKGRVFNALTLDNTFLRYPPQHKQLITLNRQGHHPIMDDLAKWNILKLILGSNCGVDICGDLVWRWEGERYTISNGFVDDLLRYDFSKAKVYLGPGKRLHI